MTKDSTERPVRAVPIPDTSGPYPTPYSGVPAIGDAASRGWFSRRRLRDWLIVGGVAVVYMTFATTLNVAEWLRRVLDRNEAIQLDEILLALAVAAFLGSILAIVRLRDVARERGRRAAIEHQYATLFDHSPHAMWVCDLETLRMLAVNEAALRTYGYSRAEFMRLRSEDLRAASDLPAIREMLANRWTTEPQYQRHGRHQRRDGSQFPVDVVAHRIEFDGRPARIILAEDVTEREDAIAALRESERLLRAVTDGIPLQISIIDAEQRYLFVNAGYERVFGRPREQIVGMTVRDLIGEAWYANARTAIEQALAGTETTRDIEEVDATGLRCIRLHFVPRRDAGGRVVGAFTIVSDESARHRLEQQFRQSQRMEAVGQLAGGVAHDFNNMLTVILSYAELIAEDPAITEDQRSDVDEVRNAALRASDLTRQLLAFSRKQTLQPRLIDVNHVVADTEKMLRRLIGEDIALELALAHPLAPVFADPAQLGQVIINLIVNARDAMPTGGRIVVESSNVTIDATAASALQLEDTGEYVKLAVHDTGCGMSRETQARIFEPFFTTKEPGRGTGLGLSTVYGIVKQSDGAVNVISALGEGTTLEVYLPAAAPATEPSVTRAPERARGGDETILLVEDEAPVRTLGRRALETRGYTVLSASNGKEALAIASAHEGRIDLVVTDVVMPEMGGIDLVRELSHLRADIRVLFASGYAAGEIARRGELPEGAHFLAKPFSLEGFARAVRRALDT